MGADVFEPDDRRRIELGLQTRETIIKELTKDGRLPQDTSSREFLLRAIEGIDTTIMKRAKIKSEDKLQEAQNQISNNIAELLKRVSTNKNNFDITENPTLDKSIIVDDLVNGETSIGISSEVIKQEILGS